MCTESDVARKTNKRKQIDPPAPGGLLEQHTLRVAAEGDEAPPKANGVRSVDIL